MSSRSTKRKRYSEIKTVLVNELHTLSVDSMDFNIDLHTTNDDFVLLFKNMEDRQSELLSRASGLQEKYRKITALLKEGKNAIAEDSSSQNVELPRVYSDNIRKFIENSNASLTGHEKDFKRQMEEMVKFFQIYEGVCKKKLNELEDEADKVVEEKAKLGINLNDYIHNVNF